MYLTMFAVMLAAIVGHTDCHLSNSERTTKQMSIEFMNPKPLHASNALDMSCIEPYDTEFCLNGGRCFNVTVATYSFPSCECATGFMGERCERKYLNRSYNPEHYMKADNTIKSEKWSNVGEQIIVCCLSIVCSCNLFCFFIFGYKSHNNPNSINNTAGEIYVGSGADNIRVSVAVIMLLAMLLLHRLILVAV